MTVRHILVGEVSVEAERLADGSWRFYHDRGLNEMRARYGLDGMKMLDRAIQEIEFGKAEE